MAAQRRRQQKHYFDGNEAGSTDLALDRLDRVNHDGDRPGVERLKALLRVDVDPRQPATKSRVRVVPPDHRFRPPGLSQHIQHLGLEDGVDGLDADALLSNVWRMQMEWGMMVPLGDQNQ